MSPSSTLSQELFKTEGKRPDLWLVQLVHERSECQFAAVKERLWASQQVVGPSLRGLRQEAHPVCSATGVLHCSSTDMVLLPCRIFMSVVHPDKVRLPCRAEHRLRLRAALSC